MAIKDIQSISNENLKLGDDFQNIRYIYVRFNDENILEKIYLRFATERIVIVEKQKKENYDEFLKQVGYFLVSVGATPENKNFRWFQGTDKNMNFEALDEMYKQQEQDEMKHMKKRYRISKVKVVRNILFNSFDAEDNFEDAYQGAKDVVTSKILAGVSTLFTLGALMAKNDGLVTATSILTLASYIYSSAISIPFYKKVKEVWKKEQEENRGEFKEWQFKRDIEEYEKIQGQRQELMDVRHR